MSGTPPSSRCSLTLEGPDSTTSRASKSAAPAPASSGSAETHRSTRPHLRQAMGVASSDSLTLYVTPHSQLALIILAHPAEMLVTHGGNVLPATTGGSV